MTGFRTDRIWELSPDLMCVLDSDAKALAANPAWQTMLGWPADMVLGSRPSDFAHPEDLAAIAAARLKVAGGEGMQDFTHRMRASDGSYRWIMWTATIEPGSGLMYAIGKDVTQQRENELRLARLAAVVRDSDDAIVGKSLTLKITDWNAGAERMYGYPAEEVLGRGFSLLVPLDRDGEERAILARVLAGETVSHFETVRLHKDGTRLEVSVTVSAIRDPDGKVIGASSTARDISVTRELARARQEVVNRLLLAAEFRDDATGQHVLRMSALCGLVARTLDWNEARAQLLESAATMHDVGKIAVPDSILLKPGLLTDYERATMQTHAEMGHKMLAGSGIAIIDLAAEIALTHHERYDGGGYPRGLSGEDIPISGRIAAAADVYDALISDRVYRPAFTPDQARAMMSAESGTQFDPAILSALFKALDTEAGLSVVNP